MQQFAKDIASVSPLHHFLVLAVFLSSLWGLLRFSRLRPYTGQILLLAAIVWMGTIFALITFSFPRPRGMMVNATSAGTIPRVWVLALVPFALLTLLPMITGKEKPDKPWKNLKLVAYVLAAIAASLLLFDYIGYYLSSALFIFVVMLLLKSCSKVQLIAVPVGWVIFTYLVFAKLLSVTLPAGRLFN